jgi:DNA-binding CsgD family transcriptional regulator
MTITDEPSTSRRATWAALDAAVQRGLRGDMLDLYHLVLERKSLAEDIVVLDAATPPAVMIERLLRTGASDVITAGADTRLLTAEAAALRRGVDVRVLLPHSALPKLATQAYRSRLTAAGGQARTVPQLWFRATVVDRRAAVVSVRSTMDGAATGILINDAGIVERVYGYLTHLWNGAVEAVAPAPDRPAGAAAELRRAVARMLASGCTDEVSARQLDMSIRSYRRHVAQLMTDLGAQSRFQAGLMARDAGLV